MMLDVANCRFPNMQLNQTVAPSTASSPCWMACAISWSDSTLNLALLSELRAYRTRMQLIQLFPAHTYDAGRDTSPHIFCNRVLLKERWFDWQLSPIYSRIGRWVSTTK
jgi:hypothetical protein